MHPIIRYDAHCHIFTLKYVLKEVKSLLHDVLNRTYPWSEPPAETALMATRGGRFREIKEFLRQLYEMLRSALGSEAENLNFLQNEANKAFPGDRLRIFPLMMDVFYMLAYPLDKDQEAQLVSGLRIEQFDTAEYQECWNEILDDLRDYIQASQPATGLRSDVTDGMSSGVSLALQLIEAERPVQEPLMLVGESAGYAESMGFYQTEGYCYHMDNLVALERGHRGEFYPFVAIDPRRPGMIDALLTGRFFEDHGNGRFYGVKLYPRMGYHPQAKRMDEVYRFCSNNHIPITYHCGMGGFPPGSGWKYTEFGNPLNFEPIIRQYPGLHINFAHMGSTDPTFTWAKNVFHLVNEYDNVFTDLSCYTCIDELRPMKKFWDDSPKLRTRLMFGTDFDVMYFTDRVTMQTYYDNFMQTFNQPGELELLMHDVPEAFMRIR